MPLRQWKEIQEVPRRTVVSALRDLKSRTSLRKINEYGQRNFFRTANSQRVEDLALTQFVVDPIYLEQGTPMQILQPPGWKQPRGYVNGVVAKGRTVFVAGQVGWNADEKFETSDFAGQARQALKNIVAVLAQAGAGPEHICRMTWYVGDRHAYNASLKELGAAYREIIGRNFPAMTAIQVAGFVEEGAVVEIEVTAVVPE